MKRVGYWMSEKKRKRLSMDEVKSLCRNAGLDLIKLDLDVSLEEQGPFDMMLHKLTDVMAKANAGDFTSQQQMKRFQRYAERRPEMVVLDPVENLLKLLDRHEQYKLVEECEIVEREYHYFTPPFVEFTTTDVEINKKLMEENGVQFPFVCKPTVAHGSSQCHQMAIIFSEEGLSDVEPPCVAQTFINHNAVLYKVYVIGKQLYTIIRPSIKNFSAGEHKTIHFDSHEVSKPHSSSSLNMLDEVEGQAIKPDVTRLEELAHALQQRLGLDLLGVDIIVENHTGRCGVIDINAFPGYDGVQGFSQILVNMMVDKLQQRRTTNGPSLHDDRPLIFPWESNAAKRQRAVDPATVPNGAPPGVETPQSTVDVDGERLPERKREQNDNKKHKDRGTQGTNGVILQNDVIHQDQNNFVMTLKPFPDKSAESVLGLALTEPPARDLRDVTKQCPAPAMLSCNHIQCQSAGSERCCFTMEEEKAAMDPLIAEDEAAKKMAADEHQL